MVSLTLLNQKKEMQMHATHPHKTSFLGKINLSFLGNIIEGKIKWLYVLKELRLNINKTIR